MDWTILIILVGLWLISPIVLLIALIVSRHQLAEARRQLAAWERQSLDKSPDRGRSSSSSNLLPVIAKTPLQPIPPLLESTPTASQVPPACRFMKIPKVCVRLL